MDQKEDTAPRQPDSSPHRLPWASPPTQGDAAQGLVSVLTPNRGEPRKIHTNLQGQNSLSEHPLCPDRGELL